MERAFIGKKHSSDLEGTEIHPEGFRWTYKENRTLALKFISRERLKREEARPLPSHNAVESKDNLGLA